MPSHEHAIAFVAPATSSKSPYRKCPGGKHSGPRGLLGAGAIVDRVLSMRHPVGVVV